MLGKVNRAFWLTAFCWLVACHPQSKQRTSAHNPPPKPPNCPKSSELRNITLKNGEVSDVRIFRDGKLTFYIPFSWYRWDIAHYNSSEPYQSPPGIYEPDVEDGECPGVIHFGNFAFMTPAADFERGITPPNVAADSALSSVTYFKAGDRSRYVARRVEEELEPFGIANEAFIRVGNRHYARYPIYIKGPNRVAGPEWDKFRADVMASSGLARKKRCSSRTF